MPRSFSGRPVLPAQARTHGRTWKCWLSWLAVSEHALVSRLTKQPSPLGRDLSKRPRGELPLAFATDEGSTCTAVGAVHAELDPAQYNPCRMLNAGRQPGFPLLCGLRGAPERRICAPPLSVAMQPSVTRVGRFAHALERWSRYVMIAHRGRRARSARHRCWVAAVVPESRTRMGAMGAPCPVLLFCCG